jgi:hypothetical protein
MLSNIHEHIPLREWLAHMSPFHANAQIRNESTRTLYITMVSEEEEDKTRADDDDDRAAVVVVSPHALEPGYSHLYSIPQKQQNDDRGGCAAARVTLAFHDSNDNNNGTVAVRLLLRRGDHLRVASL